MKSLNQQFSYKIILFLLLAGFVWSCKSDSKVTKNDISNQYVTAIKKDQIILENGDVFDLPVTDSSFVYYLVRHAEKDTLPKDNPRLTPKGYERAAKLYDMLKGTRLDAIYSTFYMRTMETVDSLADAKGMKIFPYTPQGFKELHKNIVENTDYRRILVSGHSNTTPVVANYLYDKNYFDSSFDDSDYDNFVIVVDNGPQEKSLYSLKFKP